MNLLHHLTTLMIPRGPALCVGNILEIYELGETKFDGIEKFGKGLQTYPNRIQKRILFLENRHILTSNRNSRDFPFRVFLVVHVYNISIRVLSPMNSMMNLRFLRH